MRSVDAARFVTAFILLAGIAATSGCFDIHTAQRIFYPQRDDTVRFDTNTSIAQVSYNFLGPVDSIGIVQIGAAEFHREIDNFQIARGGGTLSLFVQAHFFMDSSVTFDRHIDVTLSFISDDGESKLEIQASYASRPDSVVTVTEDIGNIVSPEPGLWSLKVEGVGTAIVSGGVANYDWFKVSTVGIYSDRSYNNNAPDLM